ncbi:PfkB family carbohydrate kinase [uncultured Bifidobacterium sp.]|uniref:PfkB family carbohydrate kinase n=1 Tax=uncultured Bifidobacterium sp. TaxID=165187 RepID=UPI0026097394|nr:PfkB family carbohydrate kinase [uncultured Bifidobacterium sp.]
MSPTSQAKAVTHTPTVISLGQIWMDIMMDVGDIPAAGGFAVASDASPNLGGSFRVLQASRKMGTPSMHAGIIGTGIWGTAIRTTLAEQGIDHIGQDRIDSDSGFRLVLNNGDSKTFIARYGAEAQGDQNVFDTIDPEPSDVVHISGNSLMDHSASGIDAFLHRPESAPQSHRYTIVINPTRSLHLVSDQLIEDTVLSQPLWSCNRQEAQTLAQRLGVDIDYSSTLTVGGGFDDAMRVLCADLGDALHAPLVLRAGSRGAWVRERGGALTHITGFPTQPIHTRSAGACHTGVMCAMIAQGWSLLDAVRIANAAASLAIQHSSSGIPQCPKRDEAIALSQSDRPK